MSDAHPPTRGRAARMLRDRWDILLVIAAGGALGSVARWALTVAIPHAADQVPWATWLANVTGAFILGLLMVFVLDFWPPSRYVRPFLGVGVLGGYTTFSTLVLDTRTLLTSGQAPAAFGYLFGTVLLGLAAVWVGVLVARTAVAVLERRHRHDSRDPAEAATGAVPAHHADSDPDGDPDSNPDSDAAARSRR